MLLLTLTPHAMNENTATEKATNPAYEIKCGAVEGRSPLLPCRGVIRRNAHNELEAKTRFLVKSTLNTQMTEGRVLELMTVKSREGIRASVRLFSFKADSETGFTSSTCNPMGGTSLELLKIPCKRVTAKAIEEAHKEAIRLFKIAYDAGKVDPSGPV